MKKVLAILLILSLCLIPILSHAGGGETPAQSPHILSAVYEGTLLSGAVENAEGASYWARCTFFQEGGSYFVLSIPVDESGLFELHIAAKCVVISVEIADGPDVQPGGACFDSARVTIL